MASLCFTFLWLTFSWHSCPKPLELIATWQRHSRALAWDWNLTRSFNLIQRRHEQKWQRWASSPVRLFFSSGEEMMWFSRLRVRRGSPWDKCSRFDRSGGVTVQSCCPALPCCCQIITQSQEAVGNSIPAEFTIIVCRCIWAVLSYFPPTDGVSRENSNEQKFTTTRRSTELEINIELVPFLLM